MKKLFITLTIIAVIIFAIVKCCGTKITQTSDTLTLEAEEKLQFQITDYFTSNNPEVFEKFVVDSSNVDTENPGIYKIVVAYKKDRYSITVNVTETVQCINDSLIVEAGEELDFQVANHFSAPDKSMLSKISAELSAVDTTKVGTYEIKAQYKDRIYPITVYVQELTGSTEADELLDQAEAEDPFNEEAYEKEQAEKIAEAEKAALEMLEQWAQGQSKDDNSNSGNNGGGNTSSSQNNGGGSSSNGGVSNNSGNQNQNQPGLDENGNAPMPGGGGNLDVDAVKDAQGDSIGKGTIGG